jgi:hypothetical protein
VFFNNILIYITSWSKHLHHVHLVLVKLQENSLFVQKAKCAFGKRYVTYLGHVISEGDIDMDAQKVRVVLDWSLPCSVYLLRVFLGLVGYYRRFFKV